MPTSRTVSNTTLFDVAAQYLGDATQWYVIAQLNGLTEVSGVENMYILTPRTLLIPDPDQSQTGGIPPSVAI